MKYFLFWGLLMIVSLLNAQQSTIVDTHKSREAIMQAAGINEVRIPSELKLEVAESEFPFGIKTLKGKALYYDEEPWDGVLYRPLNVSNKMERLPISLIPYFAWNNRGTTAMTVWLPLELQ